MTATTTATPTTTVTATAKGPTALKTPSVGLALWWSLPLPIRTALRCSCPLAGELRDGTQCLLLRVGTGSLKWLMLHSEGDGRIRCKLWKVLAKMVQLDDDVVTADRLSHKLHRLASEFDLSA